MLKIYNSLTKQKEVFKPIKDKHVGIYNCGITVYDYCHIGHARCSVVFDVVTRYLKNQGYEVKYVRNITDIDDKIINRANERDVPYNSITEQFIQAMHKDFDALNILRPDEEPRATSHIQDIIDMVQTLIDKDYAYVADNGDVYYRVKHFADYGKLSHKDIEGLQSGIRVEVSNAKHDPLDFVLWKLAKPNEPSWDSPWGAGRPGWHIECSAMSTQCLGHHFDIHGGGFDLQFPHHENEIAQAEAATGETFVNTWMHVGFVQINQEKMSKSLGNFFTIREVLAKYPAEVVRYFMLSSHYRSPVNYSDESLNVAQAALSSLYNTIWGVKFEPVAPDCETIERFEEVMNDDFNTPEALALCFDISHKINKLKLLSKASSDINLWVSTLLHVSEMLGILQLDPAEFLQGQLDASEREKINALIAKRSEARIAKDWATADAVRDELNIMGIELEDGADGTMWRKK